MIKHQDFDYIDPLDIELKEHLVHCSHVEAEPDSLPWYLDIKKYLDSEIYPEDETFQHEEVNTSYGFEFLSKWKNPLYEDFGFGCSKMCRCC